ncbi:MAG: 50S ribosomal protein L17 [Candidatus Uhrbacteria bacterium]
MRHRKVGRIFSRKTGPRGLMLRNLAASVLLHERVQTTEAKAKTVRSLVERFITIGKEPTLHHRRRLLSLLVHERAVAKVLEVLGPRYRTRPGGYTRITRIGRRLGDGAQMVIIELV